MKLLVLNGSPNREQGNTHKFLAPFLAEAERAGAEVETVYVADLNVQPCRACFSCWKQRGDCVIEDDMRWLLPKMAAADVLVLGVPLYVFHMPAPMKAILDRAIPLASPRMELVDGLSRHPRRDDERRGRATLLVSVCGFWEREHFNDLCTWTDTICRAWQARCAGKLLRPHAYAFAMMPETAPPKAAVVAALERAARELVGEGQVTPETEAAAAAEVVSQDAYLRAANQSW